MGEVGGAGLGLGAEGGLRALGPASALLRQWLGSILVTKCLFANALLFPAAGPVDELQEAEETGTSDVFLTQCSFFGTS